MPRARYLSVCTGITKEIQGVPTDKVGGVPPGWGLGLGHLGKGLSSFYRYPQTGELSKQYRVAASGVNEALEQLQQRPSVSPSDLR